MASFGGDARADCSSSDPARPSYSRLADTIKRATSGNGACKMFCGGSRCKYETVSRLLPADQAVPNLYSHWVSDSILAIARPSTFLINECKLLENFKIAGLVSVFNLQQAGEHPHCGPGLEESGFTYLPEDLMKQGFYYYNYGWADFSTPELPQLLDVVKVLSFAVQEGKVAIHCHAGLGRTGTLIACHMVYQHRLDPDTAIKTVRRKRPGSIQTRGQVDLVKRFAIYLQPLWTIYIAQTGPNGYSFEEHLKCQKELLHGEEYRRHKDIPKIVCVLCSSLETAIEKMQGENPLIKEMDTVLADMRGVTVGEIVDLEDKEFVDRSEESGVGLEGGGVGLEGGGVGLEEGGVGLEGGSSNKSVVKPSSDSSREGMTYKDWGRDVQRCVRVSELKSFINSTPNWSEALKTETFPVLFQLLLDWFWDLKDPLISCQNVDTDSNTTSDPLDQRRIKVIRKLMQVVQKVNCVNIRSKMAALLTTALTHNQSNSKTNFITALILELE